MDVFTKKQRSRIMSRIRSSGTRPERTCRAVFRELCHRRIRYNVRSLPGSPDVVVPALRLAFFIDGCYWHACPEHGRVPKSNVDFWRAKLERNVRRDRRVRRELRKLGWTVWCAWEHDLKAGQAHFRRRLRRVLSRLEKLATQHGQDEAEATEMNMAAKTAKKTTAKKTTKPTAKKATTRKPAAKKTTAKKTTAKPAAKKTATRKAATVPAV